MQKTQCI